jgi:hypothetical protein
VGCIYVKANESFISDHDVDKQFEQLCVSANERWTSGRRNYLFRCPGISYRYPIRERETKTETGGGAGVLTQYLLYGNGTGFGCLRGAIQFEKKFTPIPPLRKTASRLWDIGTCERQDLSPIILHRTRGRSHWY